MEQECIRRNVYKNEITYAMKEEKEKRKMNNYRHNYADNTC